MKKRLDVDIPTLRNQLGQQAEAAKNSLRTADAERRTRLEEELKEIARSELAAEKYEKDVRGLLTQLESGARQLERYRSMMDTHQESDEHIRAELDTMAQEIGTKLSVPLDRRIGAGAIEDLDLVARLDAIKNRTGAPQYVVVVQNESSSVQAYTAPPKASIQGQIEKLLETAKTNDNPTNGKLAIAALNKLLELNPTNAEARALRQKLLRYYGPIVLTVPLDFASIQQAIDSARSGDVIVLKPGRYRETVLMKDGLTLAGENAETCRLEPAAGYSACIYILGASHCTIKDISIDGPGQPMTRFIGHGLELEQSSQGVRVKSVLDGSPAVEQGIKAGDMICALDGDKVSTVGESRRHLVEAALHSPDKPVLIELGNMSSTRAIKVAARPIVVPEDSVPGVKLYFPRAIELEDADATLSGLSIARIPGVAVKVIRSRCRITAGVFSQNRSCLGVVEGSQADVTATTFRTSANAAIMVEGKASGLRVKGCRLNENKFGIVAKDGAECNLAGNTFAAASHALEARSVLLVAYGSKVTSMGDEFLKGGMVVVSDGTVLTVKGSSFKDMDGILVSNPHTSVDMVQCTFDDCMVAEGSMVGGAIMISEGATALLRECVFTFKKTDAVAVYASGKATSVKLRGNTYTSVSPATAKEGAKVELSMDSTFRIGGMQAYNSQVPFRQGAQVIVGGVNMRIGDVESEQSGGKSFSVGFLDEKDGDEWRIRSVCVLGEDGTLLPVRVDMSRDEGSGKHSRFLTFSVPTGQKKLTVFALIKK
ncbi:MAG: PDZ domain-containing protein [Planctomycetota bacterium]|nr:PDZ domain-containing protein [Planctomycetota bacterium]